MNSDALAILLATVVVVVIGIVLTIFVPGPDKA